MNRLIILTGTVFMVLAGLAGACNRDVDVLTREVLEDGSTPDAATPDAATPDAATPDAATPDATADGDTEGGCPPMAPQPGGSCTPDLRCEYGEETCCGETHPSYVCTCHEDGTWVCLNTDACLRPADSCEESTDCPTEAAHGQSCTGEATCNYGEETCCGETYPSSQCSCVDGTWSCGSTGACYPPACEEPTECPTDPPTPGDSCTGDATCEFGEETCCGETHPSMRCFCHDGTWSCGSTDACLLPPDFCPDAGT